MRTQSGVWDWGITFAAIPGIIGVALFLPGSPLGDPVTHRSEESDTGPSRWRLAGNITSFGTSLLSRNLRVSKPMRYKTLTALSRNAENRVDAPRTHHRTRPLSNNSHKR